MYTRSGQVHQNVLIYGIENRQYSGFSSKHSRNDSDPISLALHNTLSSDLKHMKSFGHFILPRISSISLLRSSSNYLPISLLMYMRAGHLQRNPLPNGTPNEQERSSSKHSRYVSSLVSLVLQRFSNPLFTHRRSFLHSRLPKICFILFMSIFSIMSSTPN